MLALCHQSLELDALRAQVSRLQAEKNDLVALNSELQLKADHNGEDDSFIEVIKVTVRNDTTPFIHSNLRVIYLNPKHWSIRM